MDSEEFRRHGHQFVDWMADYMNTVGDFPVRSGVAPGDIAGQLPTSAPQVGEDMSDIFADFKDIVLPGITHWQHPRFFAYFQSNASPPSVLAEMLMSTVAANCLLWQTSPAGTEMETRMMEWLAEMIGLGGDFEGVIQDSASSATLCAILTGREKATGWQVNEDGLGAVPKLAAYASVEAHSSIEKDVMVAGLGRNNLRKIAVDDDFSMIPADLEAAIEADIAAGIKPAVVIACLGTTGVGGMDDLRAIGEICRRHEVYLHVDAAWAGTALVLEENRHLIDGIEYADSFIFNPHKWMFTNFDCTAHFVRNSGDLTRTLSILPEYLKGRETGSVIDYRDWSVQLGRRFRALKLWFVMRSYGVEGIRAIVADHIAWAAELFEIVEADADFEIMSPLRLSLFSFRYRPAGIEDDDELNALNERLLNAINDDGRTYLAQTLVNGRFVIRFVTGQTTTTRDDVMTAWAAVKELASNLSD